MPWTNVESIVADHPPIEWEKRQVDDYVRRRAKPRFYVDENFPSAAIKILKRLGAHVLTVRDVRRHGHPDEITLPKHCAWVVFLLPVIATTSMSAAFHWFIAPP
jgi:hypothetical protein